MTKKHKNGLLLAALGVVLMSIESPLIKLSGFDNATASFYLGISLFISANIILLSKGFGFFYQSYKVEFKGVLLSGLFTGLGNYFFVAAVIHAGVANTVLILATTPIFSSFITWVIFKKNIHKSIFIATFFIFIGLYLILKDDFHSTSLLGIFYAFTCMISMSFLFASLTYYPNASRIGFVAMGGIFLFLFSLFRASLEVSGFGIWYILFLGLITMPLARVCVGFGARYVYPQEMSLMMILESALAPILAWWWLGEALHVNTIFGGLIIFATLIAYFLIPKKE